MNSRHKMNYKEKTILTIILFFMISATVYKCNAMNYSQGEYIADLAELDISNNDSNISVEPIKTSDNSTDDINTTNNNFVENSSNLKSSTDVNQDKNDYKVPVVLTTNNMATISTEISGTVDEILVRAGEYFKKDDLILKFNCVLLAARTKKAESDLALRKKKYDSISKLYKMDGASKIELETTRSEYEQADAEYEMAKYNEGQCIQKAPFSGQMVELYVKEHETVKIGSRLYDIVDNTNLEISIIVPSTWLMWIKKGDEFTLNISETNKTYKGTVDRIIYSVDAVSQSVKLIGQIDYNGDELFIGLSGEAVFKGPE